MVDRSPFLRISTHVLLVLGVLVIGFPIYYAVVAATLPLELATRVPMPLVPGDHLAENVQEAWRRGDLGVLLFNSLVMALGITIGKILISVLSAFAVVYFRFPGRMLAFWIIFMTLMLPVEVRIVPTYEMAVNVFTPINRLFELVGIPATIDPLGFSLSTRLEWNILDSYFGLTLPLIASATATFLFRQFFLTVPDQLTEAAKIDGAGPLRFFWDVLLPMSRTNIAALAVILFVYGWNQYLWPLLITTDRDMLTAVIGITRLMPSPEQPPEWNVAMAGALIILIPPVIVVIVMQRWFVRGLVEEEK